MRRLSCSVALAAALLPAGAFFHADTAVSYTHLTLPTT